MPSNSEPSSDKKLGLFALRYGIVALIGCWMRSGHNGLDALTNLFTGTGSVAEKAALPNEGDLTRQRMLDLLNGPRKAAHQPLVELDKDINSWLRANSNNIYLEKPDLLVITMSKALPFYTKVRVSSTYQKTMRDLVRNLDRAKDVMDETTCSMGMLIRGTPSWGYEGALVTAEKIKPFTPESIKNNTRELTYFQCPHCGSMELYQLRPRDGAYYLDCGKCRLNGGIVGSDSLGSYRYANEFLVGYQPPAVFPSNMSRELEMFIIWNSVNNNCTYRSDRPDKRSSRDVWQYGLETMVRGQGDCEDTSILLADWLIARGFKARVALGLMGRGGHAWVVVLLDDKEYLLESTYASPNINQMPLVSKVGRNYYPFAMFDRDHIYVPSRPDGRFGGQYWSRTQWLTLTPRERKDAAPVHLPRIGKTEPHFITAARADEGPPVYGGDMMPALTRLKDIPASNDSWQITSSFTLTTPKSR